jgi:acetyl-CoA acetyltransferase
MPEEDEAIIVSAARTPFGKFGLVLRTVHSTELGAVSRKK